MPSFSASALLKSRQRTSGEEIIRFQENHRVGDRSVQMGNSGEKGEPVVYLPVKRTATVEKIATIAVMAGCTPEMFPVVLAMAESGGGCGHAHSLLLKQRHPQGPFQNRLQYRVRIDHRFFAVAAAQVRVHHVSLNRAGAYQRHFNHQIVETARLVTRQRVHLRPRLHLEHADRVGPANQVIHPGVIMQERRHIQRYPPVLFHQAKRHIDQGQHPQAQQIYLDQTYIGGVIPKQDIPKLSELGVAGVFPGGTPFDQIVGGINQVIK